MNTEILQQLRGVKLLTHNGVTWIDAENPDANVFAAFEKEYGLHPVHLQESTQKVQLTEVEREAEYLFLLLHVTNYVGKRDKLVAGQIGVFLGKNYLITIHNEVSTLSRDLFERCVRDSKLREQCFHKSSGHALYSLIRAVLEDISRISEAVLQELDVIEDRVFDDNGSDAYPIGKLRQKISRLKRVIGPLKLVLPDLAVNIGNFGGDSLAKPYANNTKTANKLWEVVEEAQETIGIYKDADFTISTEKTNETLAILTLLFTLTIPATVVGALYGMNILLPGGVEAGSWDFFGKYTMFKLTVGASVLAAVLMFAYFRKKKWF